MRNLNECQAEVFRRSEIRIKARRQRRNRILMACIPLALCLAVSGAVILRNYGDSKQAPESVQDPCCGAMGENENSSMADFVEISGNGFSRYYTAAEDVQAIMTLLNQIISASGAGGEEEIKENATYDYSYTGSAASYGEAGYRILIQRSDGTTAEYFLTGLLLVDQATQDSFYMSEECYSDLKDALGVPFR